MSAPRIKCKVIAKYEDEIIQKVGIMGMCLTGLHKDPTKAMVYSEVGYEAVKEVEALFERMRHDASKCEETGCYVPDTTFDVSVRRNETSNTERSSGGCGGNICSGCEHCGEDGTSHDGGDEDPTGHAV